VAMMTAQEMFQHKVGDIYDAEHRFLTGQREMLTKATDPQLQGLILQHIEQTQQHIKNLDQVFNLLGQQPKGVMCDSAQGLVTEAQKAMHDAASDPIRDVLIDTAAAKVEHYEIASYRGLITDAMLMGQTEIQNLLQQNLQQEEQMAQLLEQTAPQLVRKALQTAGTVSGQLRQGMAVVGSDASQVGQVKEVRSADFLVDRPRQRDVYVPFDAIQKTTGDRIMLNIPADRVEDMVWEKPSLI
jgi:ferritin-like metal-binding protein YciE